MHLILESQGYKVLKIPSTHLLEFAEALKISNQETILVIGTYNRNHEYAASLAFEYKTPTLLVSRNWREGGNQDYRYLLNHNPNTVRYFVGTSIQGSGILHSEEFSPQVFLSAVHEAQEAALRPAPPALCVVRPQECILG